MCPRAEPQRRRKQLCFRASGGRDDPRRFGMTRLVRRLAALLACALFLTAAMSTLSQSSALAQTPSMKARARELYTKGQQLFRQGDYAEAQRTFEEAYVAVPNPIVLLSVAECQVRSEQY